MTSTTAVATLEELRPRVPAWERALRLARHKPLATVGLLLILLLIFTATTSSFIAPHDPLEMYDNHVMEAPSTRFLFGTDNFGRDQLSRIIWGARISLSVGVVAISIGVTIGTLLGMVSAFFEGKTDMIIQRIMDAQMSFPTIIFALSILAALGPSIYNVMIAIGTSEIPRANRIVRGSVLSEKQNVYVEAARVIGCGRVRIMMRHLLPNVTAPIIIIATVFLGNAILSEASLSFLGVGVPPPNPSWGGMLSGHSRTYMLAAPWMAIFPGVAITLAVLGWNLLGDGLRDVWDPRLRGG